MDESIRDEMLIIGTTSVKVALDLLRGQRTAFIITNISTAGQLVTLNWGKQATSGEGIVLYPGGSWSESMDAVFKPSTKAVWGIANGESATIAIHERVNSRGI